MLIKVEIYHDGDYWCARGIGEDIFTQEKDMDGLISNIKEAVELHFEEEILAGEEVRVLSLSEFEVPSVAKASSG